MRVKYRFAGRINGGTHYLWVATARPEGESRSEHITCPVDFFWNPFLREGF